MKKFFKKLITFLLVIVLVAVGIIGVAFVIPGYNAYKQAVSELPIEEKINSIREMENYTTLSEVPKIYKDAVIAVEDHRFYKHGAFSVVSIVRAIRNNIKIGKAVEGGSTITQQVAKNLYFEMDRSLTRKFAELFLAIDLEKLYSKDDILEIYINSIYFGSGYYCIYDAAKGYYDVPPIELSDFQATVLAGVPNAPSVYSPDNNTPLTYQRQRQVLDCMVEYGYLNQAEAEKIANVQ